jgi:hypothetical protein
MMSILKLLVQGELVVQVQEQEVLVGPQSLGFSEKGLPLLVAQAWP